MDAAGTAMIDDQELARRLRATGLRATRPRLLVLEVLQETGPHLSTDELVEALDARGTPLPRGSVYNVVGALATHGLMMVTNIGPDVRFMSLPRGGIITSFAAPVASSRMLSALLDRNPAWIQTKSMGKLTRPR